VSLPAVIVTLTKVFELDASLFAEDVKDMTDPQIIAVVMALAELDDDLYDHATWSVERL
jgi:hypothetical protein